MQSRTDGKLSQGRQTILQNIRGKDAVDRFPPGLTIFQTSLAQAPGLDDLLAQLNGVTFGLIEYAIDELEAVGFERPGTLPDLLHDLRWRSFSQRSAFDVRIGAVGAVQRAAPLALNRPGCSQTLIPAPVDSALHSGGPEIL